MPYINRLHEYIVGDSGKGTVAYWIGRDQRAYDNWALLYAQEVAVKSGSPLLAFFCLAPQLQVTNKRQQDFMIAGLKKLEITLNQFNIPFVLLKGEPEVLIPEFITKNGISFLVTDFDPLRIKKQWNDSISKKIKIPFHEIDAHNIVPCRHVSPKQEYAAYTFRPKIIRMLEEHLTDFERPVFHKYNHKTFREELQGNHIDSNVIISSDVSTVTGFEPGEEEGMKVLYDFINNKLNRYADYRNDPNEDAVSNISPYLHFGMISAQRAALEVMQSGANPQSKSAFIEELVVRRELADNYCFYNDNYDNFDGISAWAKDTLNAHRHDPREYIYSSDELEFCRTHDRLWNAAQAQMVNTGKMHGYLRMFWAKKILEWSESPEKAFETAIYLNDKYELDGCDPNGYTGVAWSLGGLHDRPWFERKVFGKVRYMSFNGLKRRFDVNQFIKTNLI